MTSFCIFQPDVADSSLGPQSPGALENPDECQESKGESRPVNEGGASLMRKNGPKRPSDSDAGRQVAFLRRKGVSRCGRFEEEQGQEYEHLGPNTRGVRAGVHAERFEGCDDDKDSGPSVIKREREMDEDFVSNGRGRVMLLDLVVDVGNRRRNKKGEHEGPDVVVVTPQVDINGVQDTKKSETPGDMVDDDVFSIGEELIDDSSQQKEVDQGPDEERPGRRADVSFLAVVITFLVGSNGIDVGAEKEEVDDNVNDFEEDTVFPRRFLCVCVVGHFEG